MTTITLSLQRESKQAGLMTQRGIIDDFHKHHAVTQEIAEHYTRLREQRIYSVATADRSRGGQIGFDLLQILIESVVVNSETIGNFYLFSYIITSSVSINSAGCLRLWQTAVSVLPS
ncbi:MAG: hypothetical protein ACSLEL_04635 [Candidatus Malihini olakiniferum]